MSTLTGFIGFGVRHILAWDALDHLLFLLALVAPYRWRDWRRLAVVVSAFTVGHTTTLGLVAMHLMTLPTRWIEFLIPVTIVLAAIRNLRPSDQPNLWMAALLAGAFGLVHGAGFARSLQGLFGDSVAVPLLGFNLGIEVGQLVVVTVLLSGLSLLDRGLVRSDRRWVIDRAALVSMLAAAGGATMAWGRLPW